MDEVREQCDVARARKGAEEKLRRAPRAAPLSGSARLTLRSARGGRGGGGARGPHREDRKSRLPEERPDRRVPDHARVGADHDLGRCGSMRAVLLGTGKPRQGGAWHRGGEGGGEGRGAHKGEEPGGGGKERGVALVAHLEGRVGELEERDERER